MPAYLWRTEIFSIPTTMLELMIYILFLIWLAGRILTSPCPLFRKEGKISLALFFKRGINPPLAKGGLGGVLNFSISQFLFKKTVHNSQFTIHNSKLIAGIVLLFLGLTISTIISTDIKTSAGIFKGWFIDPFLFFLVLINVIKTKKQIIHLFSAWALSGLAVAIISLFYLITGDLTYDGRLKAFFLSPNHLVMYLSPAFLVSLVFLLNKLLEIGNWRPPLNLLLRKEGKIKNILLRKEGEIKNPLLAKEGAGGGFRIEYCILYITILIIIFIPLYFTFSYGAFLGIAAAVFYLIFVFFRIRRGIILNYKPSLRGNPPAGGDRSNLAETNQRAKLRDCRALFRYRSTPLAMTAVVILCFFIFSSILFLSAGKFQQIVDSQSRSSFHSRLMIWDASREILKDNFVFGIGPGTFQEVYLSYADKFSEPYLEWAVPQPHNIFLALWLQTGIIGLLGFILILIWFFNNIQIPLAPFNKGGRKFHNSQFTIPIILMIYFLIHGLTDTTYWKNDLSLMFWTLIGVMVIYRNGAVIKDDSL